MLILLIRHTKYEVLENKRRKAIKALDSANKAISGKTSRFSQSPCNSENFCCPHFAPEVACKQSCKYVTLQNDYVIALQKLKQISTSAHNARVKYENTLRAVRELNLLLYICGK